MTRAAKQQLVPHFLEKHRLPEKFAKQALNWYMPLISDLQSTLGRSDGTVMLGINGTQGSGKSTLADFVSTALEGHGITVANLSLDDFYLRHEERERLAERVHPLLQTRGVPGTHDLGLLQSVLDSLESAGNEDTIAIPRFDKAQDDRLPPDQWSKVVGPVDLVILEGWCVGSRPQSALDLRSAVNELEESEDADGLWRDYVNTSLAGYQSVFSRLDQLIMLKAPGFESVYRWRRLQESKLKSAAAERGGGHRVMGEQQLGRFIQHFQRITEQTLSSLPACADLVFFLDDDQSICAQRRRSRVK